MAAAQVVSYSAATGACLAGHPSYRRTNKQVTFGGGGATFRTTTKVYVIVPGLFLVKTYSYNTQGADGRIILIWIFRKWDVGAWTESSWLRIGTGGGHL